MKDKYEIAIWNHINFFMSYEQYDSFNRNGNDIKTSELINKVQKQIGATPGLNEFMNPGNLFSLLYTSLVVPKEMFKVKEKAQLFFKNLDLIIEEFFNIEVGLELVSNKYEFLRMIRNAVSHVNFEWNKDRSEIVFWNIYRNEKNFIAITSLNKLIAFCLRLSEYLAKNKDSLY